MIKLPSVLTWSSNNTIIKISFFFVLLFLTSFKNDKDQSSEIEPDINIYDSNISREKVYLHFDKPYYSSGDDIWFKVYLVNSNTNQQTALSKIVYVDLIDLNHNIIDSKAISVENGNGFGDFKLDIKLDSGEYLIRAYTNYMRNYDHAYFFRKSFYMTSILTNQAIDKPLDTKNSIIDISDINVEIERPDIQFLPEGGNMVNNFPNRVGFKAIGVNGKGIDIQGVILDNHGTKISAFKTSKFGLGLFNIIPEPGKSYKAYVKYMGQDLYYDLPKALNTGVVIQVREFEDYFQISLSSSLKNGAKDLTLIGRQKDKLVSEAHLKGNRNKAKIIVSKSDLGQGIAQFTILDKYQIPLCERLIFVEKGVKQTKVNLKLLKDTYKKRELVEIDLLLNETVKKTDQTGMSVSITDISVVNKNPYDLNIKSYLLLNSELKGNIEDPEYYFIDEDPLRKRNLDILMLTQGWRKYLFTEKLNDSLIQFKFEKGVKFCGIVKDNNNPIKTNQAEVSLVIKENDQILYDKIETDLDGHFEFGDFDIKDSASIVIQVEKVKRNDQYKSPRNQFSIIMDSIEEFDKPSILFKFNKKSQIKRNDETIVNDNYTERSKSFQFNNSMFENDKNRELLDEVFLKEIKVKTEAKQKEEEYKNKLKRTAAIYKTPSQRLDFNELGYIPWGNALDALQSRVPGLSIIKEPFPPYKYKVTLRGNTSLLGSNSPMFLLNNVPIGIDAIESISAQNIHFVDVLKGYRAAIYGSRASNGIIAIYTKDGTEKDYNLDRSKKTGILNITYPGTYQGRKFYEPKYAKNKPDHQKPDYRSTLCWRPNIKLDAEGKAKISFYAADIPTSYRVDLQGITSDGIPFTAETFIDVE